ncbi:MAG: trypsin-like peptidase domain-containing protein [Planctomycetota bacterium]|jgi:serine protease Do
MPRAFLGLLLLALVVHADEAEDLAKARARVRALETDLQALIDKVSPSVGAIVNYSAAFDPATGKVAMRPRSLGSGTVVDPRGFVLTNVHVIQGAGYLTVTLPDGVRYPAVFYADTSEGAVKGDIAVIKMRGKKRFPAVSWNDGKASKLEPGAFVLAMGNPHGHALDGQPVVTMGIVSGKGRAAAETGYLYIDSLQTDAEINPGNSGGPLFDSRGRFVGINGLMNSRQGRSNSGVGFAIPVDQVRLFMRKLLKDEGGGVGYGFHGLTHVATSGIKGGGAVVQRLVARSPAAEAGMRTGDIVVKVGRSRVRNRTEFVNLIGKLPEGKSVSVSYKRGRAMKVARFKLANYNEFLEEIGRKRKPSGPRPVNLRGYLGAEWKKTKDGVALTTIQPLTGAEKAKLREGDVIVSLDGKPVSNPVDLASILMTSEPDQRVKLKILRSGRPRTLSVELCDAAGQAGMLD